MSGVMEQQVPEGYKQTEAGVIPRDWDIYDFGDLVNYTKGYPFKSADYMPDGARIIRVSDTTFDSIEDSGAVYISLDKAKKYKKWQLKFNDLIFSTVGSKPPMYDSLVGKAILVTAKHDGSLLNQNAVIIRAKNFTSEIQKLLLNHFRTERYIDYIEIIYRGNANQASITLKNLFEFKLPLPKDKKEQTAIANALSDVDALITSLEKLIAKKRAIKTAAMQQLLTGKKRLPPFDTLAAKNGTPAYKQTELGEIPVDWEVVNLNNLCSIMTGNTPSTNKPEYYGEEFLFVSPADLQGQKYIKSTGKRLSQDGFNICRQYPKASILFTCIGSTIGKCGIASDKLTSNQQINAVLPSEKVDMDYLYYQLLYTAPVVKQQASEQAVPIVNKTQFGEHLVLIPNNRNEQKAISSFLSDIDSEIECIGNRLNKTQQLKQGMMQELLTGRTRLVKPGMI